MIGAAKEELLVLAEKMREKDRNLRPGGKRKDVSRQCRALEGRSQSRATQTFNRFYWTCFRNGGTATLSFLIGGAQGGGLERTGGKKG